MTRFVASVLSFSITAACLGVGCSSDFSSRGDAGDGDGDADIEGDGDGDGDDPGEGVGDGDGDEIGGEAGAGGLGGRPSVVDEPRATGGHNGEPPAEPVCDPQDVDVPDDEFFDANCDGIDGDVNAAIFVSLSGSGSGTGSMDDPLNSINEAVSLAQDEEKDVYVCLGNYEESVLIEVEGVNLYGGYDCDDGWKRGEERTVVAPLGYLTAIQLRTVYDVTLSGFEFRAPYVPVQGGSSIAGMVEGVQGLVLNSVAFVAADGADGASGNNAVPYLEGQRGLAGVPGGEVRGVGACNNCYGIGGTSDAQNVCPNGQRAERGGYGGNGADPDGDPGWKKGLNSPESGRLGGQAQGQNGYTGGAGATGTRGAQSPRQLGEIGRENGFLSYLPTNSGGDGGYGGNGEAGGGGAGAARWQDSESYHPGGGGGQGGYGACGGRPGQGGEGGGASIALLVVGSSVTFSNVTLATGKGGRGGDAGAGAPGQLASEGGPGRNSGGDGGDGGRGGQGGHGAPGGGGPALGLALSDSTLAGTSSVVVVPGVGGDGGVSPANLPDGDDGVVLDAYDFGQDREISL